jgi:hypothetical protein
MTKMTTCTNKMVFYTLVGVGCYLFTQYLPGAGVESFVMLQQQPLYKNGRQNIQEQQQQQQQVVHSSLLVSRQKQNYQIQKRLLSKTYRIPDSSTINHSTETGSATTLFALHRTTIQTDSGSNDDYSFKSRIPFVQSSSTSSLMPVSFFALQLSLGNDNYLSQLSLENDDNASKKENGSNNDTEITTSISSLKDDDNIISWTARAEARMATRQNQIPLMKQSRIISAVPTPSQEEQQKHRQQQDKDVISWTERAKAWRAIEHHEPTDSRTTNGQSTEQQPQDNYIARMGIDSTGMTTVPTAISYNNIYKHYYNKIRNKNCNKIYTNEPHLKPHNQPLQSRPMMMGVLINIKVNFVPTMTCTIQKVVIPTITC